MSIFLQIAVAQAAIAVSVFNLITYLWLGLTVLLNGNRASLVTWVGGIGLLGAALFFLCHGALVGSGVPAGPSPSDFWWRLAWLPAFVSPLVWAAIGLHYADLFGPWKRLRALALEAVAALGILAAILALLSWPAIAHYGDFIRLLDASLRVNRPTPPPAAGIAALPWLGVAFVIYVTCCALLPWVSLGAARRLAQRDATSMSAVSASAAALETSGAHPMGTVATHGTPGTMGTSADERRVRPAGTPGSEATLLWDARDAWARARRALLTASLLMMAIGIIVAAIGVLTSLAAHRAAGAPASLPVTLPVPTTRPGHVPVGLVATDLVVQLALAGVGMTVGWSVVRQGILVERRLPQRGFLSHWRGVVIVAAIFAAVIAGMGSIEPVALPELLVLVALVSAAYALFTWQSYVAHDRTLAQLRPFVASLAGGHSGWLAADPQEVERSVEELFTSLCRDALGASRGRLSLSAGKLHMTVSYRASESEADPHDAREWALPVSDERGVVARLVFGPRADGAGYTSADLEIARACGQRILDALGEFAAAQAIATLARQRGLESELSAALPRRVLHDEVLPRLHLAMLRLEAMRFRAPAEAAAGGSALSSTMEAPMGTRESREASESSEAIQSSETTQASDANQSSETTRAVDIGQREWRTELSAVVEELGRAHRDLAALMRAAPIVNQRRLQDGLVSALRAALDGEFRGTFDDLELEAPADACAAADALSPLVADLLLGAALEAVRNAGKHARGGDLHRRLRLRVTLAAEPGWVSAAVRDDGVGLQSELPPELPREDLRDDAHNDVSATRPPDVSELAADIAHRSDLTPPGARSGLLTHGALIALVGGSLAVHTQPDAGTTITVRVPRSALSSR